MTPNPDNTSKIRAAFAGGKDVHITVSNSGRTDLNKHVLKIENDEWTFDSGIWQAIEAAKNQAVIEALNEVRKQIVRSSKPDKQALFDFRATQAIDAAIKKHEGQA